MQKVLYLNTESIKLSDQNDKYTGITIKTPDDVRDMIAGSIIVIGGVEWMLRNDGWVSTEQSTETTQVRGLSTSR